MFDYLYEWLRDISYYLILVTAVTYVLPSNSYRKYIRFFTGLVLILMLLTPVRNLFRIEDFRVDDLYSSFESEYKMEMSELINDVGGVSESIEVEDIVIGP